MTLQQEFIRRFADLMAVEGLFDFPSSPCVCDIEATTVEMQIELIHLLADNCLKMMFISKPLNEFYLYLHLEKFQNLKKIARKMFVLCASTYIYEKTFSIMIVYNGPNRSLFTHSNLQSVLRISTSDLTPNFDKLVGYNIQTIYHSN